MQSTYSIFILIAVVFFSVDCITLKDKGISLDSRHLWLRIIRFYLSSSKVDVYASSIDVQPIDPTLDLCTRYPLLLDGPKQYGILSLLTLLHVTSTGNQNPNLLILCPIPCPLGLVSLKYKYLTGWSLNEASVEAK